MMAVMDFPSGALRNANLYESRRKNLRCELCQCKLLGTYRDFFFRKGCASGLSALLMTEPMLLAVLLRT